MNENGNTKDILCYMDRRSNNKPELGGICSLGYTKTTPVFQCNIKQEE